MVGLELLELLLMMVGTMGVDPVVAPASVAEWVEVEVVEESIVIGGTSSSSSEKSM